MDELNSKASYIEALQNKYLPMVKRSLTDDSRASRAVQEEVFSQLFARFEANIDEFNRELLNREETDEFFALAEEILQLIDDDVILDSHLMASNEHQDQIRSWFIYLKHGDEGLKRGGYTLINGKLVFSINNAGYTIKDASRIVITCINQEHGKLVFDAAFSDHYLMKCYPEAISICCGNKTIPYKETGVYSLTKAFGRSISKQYTFSFETSLNDIRQSGLRFSLHVGDREKPLPLQFFRAPSRLFSRLPHSYWMISDDEALIYDKRKTEIKIIQMNRVHKKRRELVYHAEAAAYLAGSAIKNRCDYFDLFSVIRIRRVYWKDKDKYRGRRIWLYFDKLFKAGDNGEYAFRYAFHHDKDIESYYVINSDCPDYPRLKKEFGNRILVYGSFKCKMLALFAETIVATHPDIIQYLGYTSRTTHTVKDLFNAKLVCIAHGVTIQKNADYQNRIFDNTMFYTTSSKYEVKHLLHPCYGYTEDQIALTGMARFDGLKNDDKKQILITPTWRRSLVKDGDRETGSRYNEDFKKTNYFKIYNSLINDQRIIDTARKTGYRVVFLVHPLMSVQIDDYDRNDSVDIVPMSGDVSYEKVLTDSSLMITDYSGIHYDFGYMRKPVIYYQPNEIPMRFEEGGMKFATMGFGPLCTEYEKAVQLICSFMEQDCRMPEEYRKRADDFFAFYDYSNAKRIHEAIKEWINTKQSVI